MFYAGHTVLDLALLPTPSDDAIFVAAVGSDGEKGQLSLWEVSTITTGTFESVLHGSSSWKETVSCVKGRESLLCLAHGKQLDVAKYTITLTDRLGIDLAAVCSLPNADAPLSCVDFLNDTTVVAGAESGSVYLCDVASGAVATEPALRDVTRFPVNAVACNGGNGSVVLGSSDPSSQLAVWDPRAGPTAAHRWGGPELGFSVNSLAFIPQSPWLLAAGSSSWAFGSISVWDSRYLRRGLTEAHTGTVWDLACAEGAVPLLCSAGSDGVLQRWSLPQSESGSEEGPSPVRMIARIPPLQSADLPLNAVSLFRNAADGGKQYAVTGSDAGMVNISPLTS